MNHLLPRPYTFKSPEREALENFNRRLTERMASSPLKRDRGRGGRPPWRPRRPYPGCGLNLGALLTVLSMLALVAILCGTLIEWVLEQRGPVHVLVLGIDERPQEQGPFRSDTMILAAFQPRRDRVALLSIPRDLWVTIPGVGENRVNAANFFGGPPLAKATVAETFGVPIHYYVKLNFDGFVDVVDALGGIEVDVAETLHDENYPTPDYSVTTIHIEAGSQHFDGEEALIYARSRYSTNDFDRARRQQEILAAIRRRLLQPGAWIRLPAVVLALSQAVETDIPPAFWPGLAFITVRADEIRQARIGADAVFPFTTDEGGEVLLPAWDVINRTLEELFGEGQ